MSYYFEVSEQTLNEDENTVTSTPIVSVPLGSLALVSYASKEASDLMDGETDYSVELLENLADGETRRIVVLTANGRVVNTVVAAELRQLRKLAKAGQASPEASVS